jgi:hypothetical protein
MSASEFEPPDALGVADDCDPFFGYVGCDRGVALAAAEAEQAQAGH